VFNLANSGLPREHLLLVACNAVGLLIGLLLACGLG